MYKFYLFLFVLNDKGVDFMRKLNRGENLIKTELQEIANNYYITPHAIQRMSERGLDKRSIKDIILNPLVAYFNTDGSINIAKDEFHYLVIKYNGYFKNYQIITYKEPSLNGKNIFQKQELATKGIHRVA